MKKSGKPQSQSFLKIKVPGIYLVAVLIVGGFANLWLHERLNADNADLDKPSGITNDCPRSMRQVRGKDYQFIRPLYLASITSEALALQPVKKEISKFIEQQKCRGTIENASVYLRKMNDGQWITVNGNQQYDSHCITKIIMLVAYLKNAEKNPAILNNELKCETPRERSTNTVINDKSIELGKNYKVRDLLYSMVVHSDDLAESTLSKNIDHAVMRKICNDLDINIFDKDHDNTTFTASDISRFFGILYNSTYLKNDYSEYALTLLTQSTFSDGIIKLLPHEIKAAHKFGVYKNGNNNELSESGIVYMGENTYLITIMTKGKDMNQLPGVISYLSKLVFDKIKN
jgi:beta-lactamase class A